MRNFVSITAALALLATSATAFAQAQDSKNLPVGQSEALATTPIKEARQAVAVDDKAFYAIDNTTIVKYDKESGKQIASWEGHKDGPILHLDSGVVIDGKLYAAHSNYPKWPMTSSIEIWDVATMKHVGSHSLGIDRGSLTWLDRDAKGVWWGAFANYNRVFDKSPIAYGNKYNTQIVRFDDKWRIEEAFVLPDALVAKFGDMSNSGGSWGADGKLYITGHDNAEVYVMDLPEMGAEMRWLATIPMKIAGQGIAWDRSKPGIMYGIIRDKTGNNVTVNKITASGLK